MSDLRGLRVAMVGIGKVGAAAAYSIIHKNFASEVLVLDVKSDYRDAQIEDICDATSFGISPRVRAGTWKECGQCDIIVFTAGTNQKPGENRLSLLQRNLTVLKTGLAEMRPLKEDAIFLCVVNPVDVMTYFAIKYTGLPPSQVFGSGTSLDTTRLKDAIAQRADVAPRSVNAYVVGEHGDSQTVAWSNIAIGGIPMKDVLPLDVEERQTVGEWVRFKANRLNTIKGETSFGVGAMISQICQSIALDEKSIMPLSHYQTDYKVCFSRPAVLGRRGIVKTLNLHLDQSEQASLERSAKKLQGVAHGAESPVSVEQMTSRL